MQRIPAQKSMRYEYREMDMYKEFFQTAESKFTLT